MTSCVGEYDKVLNSSKKFASSLTKLNLLCLLNLGDYQSIFDKTEDWSNDQWPVLKGVYRASAFKRKVELKHNDYNEKENAYKNVFEIYNELFKKEDYGGLSCNEIIKVIKELSNIDNEKKSYSEEFIFCFVQFIADHYFNILSVLKEYSIDSRETKRFLERLFLMKFNNNDNPLHKVRWYSPEKDEYYDVEHILELKEKGYEIVKVYHIPEGNFGMSNSIFAKNDSNQQFYLHVDDFAPGWTKWGTIGLDDKLGIICNMINIESSSHTLPRASEIVEIEKYEM